MFSAHMFNNIFQHCCQQGCQQYCPTTCPVLLTTMNNVGSRALFNPVFNNGNLPQLVIFTRVTTN